MDIKELFPKNTLSKRIVRSITLSHRLYRHLSEEEKNLFDEYSKIYPSDIWAFAIIISKKQKKTLRKKHFKLAKIYYPKLIKSTYGITKDGSFNPGNIIHEVNHFIKDKYLIKELIFRGFVPIGNRITQHKRYGYLATNRPLEGNYYQYNKKYYANPKPGKPTIGNEFQDDHAKIGFGNLIRMVYPSY